MRYSSSKYSLFFLLFGLILCFSQNVKIGGGFGVSKINASGAPVLDNNIDVFSFFLGLDALEKENFYLSNEIGFLQLGGKETNPNLPTPFTNIEKKWNYIYASSTFRYKLFPKTNSFLFIGAGPKVNILASSSNFKNTLYEGAYEMQKVNFGINTELGFSYDWNRFRIGINGSYLLFLSPIAKNDFNTLKGNPLGINMSFGINL